MNGGEREWGRHNEGGFKSDPYLQLPQTTPSSVHGVQPDPGEHLLSLLFFTAAVGCCSQHNPSLFDTTKMVEDPDVFTLELFMAERML